MGDLLLGFSMVMAGSLLWFGIQTSVWYVSVDRIVNDSQARKLLAAGGMFAPLLGVTLWGITMLTDPKEPRWTVELVILPAVLVWVVFLSWLGLRMAVTLKRRAGRKPSAE